MRLKATPGTAVHVRQSANGRMSFSVETGMESNGCSSGNELDLVIDTDGRELELRIANSSSSRGAMTNPFSANPENMGTLGSLPISASASTSHYQLDEHLRPLNLSAFGGSCSQAYGKASSSSPVPAVFSPAQKGTSSNVDMSGFGFNGNLPSVTPTQFSETMDQPFVDFFSNAGLNIGSKSGAYNYDSYPTPISPQTEAEATHDDTFNDSSRRSSTSYQSGEADCDEPAQNGSRASKSSSRRRKGDKKSFSFPCRTGCEKEFSREYTRQLHEAAHEGIICSVPGCGTRFKRRHDRMRHEQNMHGLMTENHCERCNKTFLSKNSLRDHRCN